MSKLDPYRHKSVNSFPEQMSGTRMFSADQDNITQTRKVRRMEHWITHTVQRPKAGNIGTKDNLGRKWPTETKHK